MKYLAIDYGKKNIGLAISDKDGLVAMPYKILPNSKLFFDKLKQIVKEEEIEAFVLGWSTDFKKKDNKVNFEIKKIKEKIKENFQKDIFLIDESFTSMEAKWGIEKQVRRPYKKARSKKNVNLIDHKAAAMILKTFLDRKNK